MTSNEIREKFLKFFEANEHTRVLSSSLLPDDPSVLLTTAGMQQFKPYFTGQANPIKDFDQKSTTSSQKCFRTSDIDEVGDERHLTFFEMLGNFSFGGYFKKEAIKYAHDFIKELGLEIDYVTIFGGDSDVPQDLDSEKYWLEFGIPKEKIKKMGREDNFWGPTGNEGPCGPTTEIYVKPSPDTEAIEIWNVVFNEFYCRPDKHLEKLSIPGIDTGMGLERLAAVVQKVPTVFDTDLFEPILEIIKSKESGTPSRDTNTVKAERIVADHIKGAAFLLADGIRPSNVTQGYILRRIIRRSIRYAKTLGLPADFYIDIIDGVVKIYGQFYINLTQQKKEILDEMQKEIDKFEKAVDRGIKKFEEFYSQKIFEDEASGAKYAFELYETYGFPFELTEELVKERGGKLNKNLFEDELSLHQEISRVGVEKKFGGHGLKLDTGELKAASEEELQKVTRLHTATHLLHAGLRKVLGDTIQQRGSDITSERLRFDFIFDRKLTDAEKMAAEKYVNDAVDADVEMIHKEMPFDEAIASEFLAFFRGKYPAIVSTYELPGWSKEVCGGPHVSRSGEVGKFKIIKDEASSAGVRRIRATIE